MIVYTSGYEGKTIDGFVRQLKEHGIALLVDIRELPLSRKPGFSKSAIQAALRAAGIEYVHLRELGTPRAIRQELRKSGHYQKFLAQYRDYLKGQEEALNELIGMAAHKTVCLMCYEEDPHRCHRSVVAEHLHKHGIGVRHL